jgi:DNA-binding transcriptional ArsR family regulator
MPPPTRSVGPSVIGISPETATALADPTRCRILIEISLRALSPSQFVETFGGDLSQVSRCFRQLEAWGLAEVVEERPGRRGATVEHIYRGIQRGHFEKATWESLPKNGRGAGSRSVVNSFFEQASEAIDADTFDQEPGSHLRWTGVLLDREAWVQLVKRLKEVLELLAELEVESAARLAENDVERIPAVASMTAFRAAQPPELLPKMPQEPVSAPCPPGAPFVVKPEAAKALSNRCRSRIMAELLARPMSPSRYVEEIGGDPSYVARCFRELAAWGYLEIFEERRGGRHGGGIERVYKSAQHPYFDTPSWESLPRFLRTELTNFYLAQYRKRIVEAMEAGTFDAEPESRLSWKSVVLDREAWRAMGAALTRVFYLLPELERESLSRTGSDLKQMIPTIVGLVTFRAPSSAPPAAEAR